MKRFLFLLLFICVCITACSGNEQKSSVSFFAMDTFMRIDAYGDNSVAAELAKDEVLRLEKLLSVTDKNSEIYMLNNGAEKPSSETLELIKYTLKISEKTDGALDPTIYPVLRAWGFTTGEYRVVPEEELRGILNNTGYSKVNITDGKITLSEGVMLDLGAIAKGYASEKCSEIIRENGVKSALIDLGGNICLVGNRPNGEPWKIGITNPKGEGYAGILSASDCAIVTSGIYQRYFEENGVKYGHIIDTKTGKPADNDLLSVTIISDNGTLCDALSTALFAMGAENAEKYWRENSGFDVIFITKNNEVRVTSGIYDNFTLDESAGYKLVKITR